MADGPLQNRAKVWAWVYLVLFGPDGRRVDEATEAADEETECQQETLGSPDR